MELLITEGLDGLVKHKDLFPIYPVFQSSGDLDVQMLSVNQVNWGVTGRFYTVYCRLRVYWKRLSIKMLSGLAATRNARPSWQ